MPTNASPTWPHLSLIRTVIAHPVETAFADKQDLHEPGVFFSRDRILNFPPFRGAVRGQHSLSISIYRFWFFGFQLCLFDRGQPIRTIPGHNTRLRQPDWLTWTAYAEYQWNRYQG